MAEVGLEMTMMNLLAQEFRPPHGDTVGVGLGIAAVLLVGGWLFTRWQRDRMRFALMRAALEKGVTRFPGTPPYWLVSLRQGFTLAVVGVGIGILGGGAWWMAQGVEMPAARLSPATQPAELAEEQPAPPPPRPEGRLPLPEDRDFGPPPRPGDPGFGPPPRPGEAGPLHWERVPGEPHGEPRPAPPRHDEPRPAPHDPALDRWHHAEAQKMVGLASVGVGFILLLVGIVRIGFAKIEQRYVTDTDDVTTIY